MKKKFKNKWLEVGDASIYKSGECYYVKNKYRRECTLAYDWYKREYILKSELKNFYIGKVFYNYKLIEGYMSSYSYKYFNIYYLDLEALIADNYTQSGLTPESYIIDETNYSFKIPNFNFLPSKNRLECFNVIDNYSAINSSYFKSFCRLETHYANNSSYNILSKYLDPFTFGLEFETSFFSIKDSDLIENRLIAVRDGSISGHEVCTAIIPGKSLPNRVGQICDLLSLYSDTNFKCSFHIHIGNIVKSKKVLISLYNTIYRIQSELIEMFPGYKKDIEHLRNQEKDYCQLLPNLGYRIKSKSEYADNIIYWASNSEIKSWDEYASNMNNSIADLNKPKYKQNNRYYIVNFFSYLFGNTLEFRLHPGTTNKYRVILWSLICTAIVKYACDDNNKSLSEMSKLTLADIIDAVFWQDVELAESIKDYIAKCKSEMLNYMINHNIYPNTYMGKADYLFKWHLPNFNFEDTSYTNLKYAREYAVKKLLEEQGDQVRAGHSVRLEEDF